MQSSSIDQILLANNIHLVNLNETDLVWNYEEALYDSNFVDCKCMKVIQHFEALVCEGHSLGFIISSFAYGQNASECLVANIFDTKLEGTVSDRGTQYVYLWFQLISENVRSNL